MAASSSSAPRKKKYVRKTSSDEELRAAHLAGLMAGRAERYNKRDFLVRESMGLRDAQEEKWRDRVERKGWPYYKDHRAPPKGWWERGREATWTPGKTHPKAFVERYDDGYVYLVPKTRAGGYSGTRHSMEPTPHYKRLVIGAASSQVANRRDGRVPKSGTSLDSMYKWARGYLKRHGLRIPAKTRANMGLE